MNISGEFMPVAKGGNFAHRDVYINYSFEEVMYRWDHQSQKLFVKFYGEKENPRTVAYDNELFNDALLSGEEISLEEYRRRK
jgi:hypothetical protein